MNNDFMFSWPRASTCRALFHDASPLTDDKVAIWPSNGSEVKSELWVKEKQFNKSSHNKMVIPLLDTESAPHWFAANLSMDNTTVEIRDSLSSAMHKRSRRSTCVEMTLDQLFAPVKPGDLNFSEFVNISSSKDYPQQQNGHDCVVFVIMKYMESLFEENEIMVEVFTMVYKRKRGVVAEKKDAAKIKKKDSKEV